MATLQINGKVLPFKKGDDDTVKYYKSPKGDYANFVVLEQRYNKIPMRFMCTVEGSLIEKLKKCQLRVGDYVKVTGELENYKYTKGGQDMMNSKIIVYDLEFIVLRGKVKDSKDTDTDSLEDCDLFQESIN